MTRDVDLITSGPKAGRIRCCIMGCGRTFKDEGYEETICGKHFRLADKRLVARIKAVERFIKKQSGGWNDRTLELHHKIWVQIVEQAQKRSLGI